MPQTSPTGRSRSTGSAGVGITKTPSGRFLPMWLAILASVFVGAKPTPQGMPIHWRIVARIAAPCSAYDWPAGRFTTTNASSMEYGITSGAKWPRMATRRRERSP